MREELEKRLGSLQQELSEATAAKHKALRDLNSAKIRYKKFVFSRNAEILMSAKVHTMNTMKQ
jgi:hypothetical protein